MRRLALLVCLIVVPSLAWSADGVRPQRMTVVKPPVVTALRGPLSAAPAKPALFSPVPQSTVVLGADAATVCRLSCAQARYFCEADPQAGDCGGTWGQCAAACSAPNLAPPTGRVTN
jgi:hypothetical protein